MSINSAAASAMPRLPVTWQEFSQLLRSYQTATRPASESNPVDAVDSISLNVQSDPSNGQAALSNWADKNLGTWSSTTQHGSNGAHNPVDSPHAKDFSGGIDVWA